VYDERVRATLIALLSSLASCYSSRAVDCAVRCGAGAQPCASGFRCDGTSGLCVGEGFTGTCGGDGGPGGEPQSACATEQMIVMMDPSDGVPAGWTCVSCAPSDLLFERFVVGSDAFGAQGGSMAHAHTFTTPAVSNALEQPVNIGGMGNFDNSDTLHAAGPVASTTSASHLPRYNDLMLIQPLAAVTELPKGAIIMIDTPAVPNSAFSVYTSQQGLYIRAGAVTGTGGASDHTHTFDVVLPNAVSGQATFGVGTTPAAKPHNHRVQGSFTSPNDPAHVQIVLAQATEPTPLPGNAVAFFAMTPGGPWTVLSGPGGPLAKQFLKGALSPSFTSPGSTARDPGPGSAPSGPATASDTYAAGAFSTQPEGHTHLVPITFSVEDVRPPYTEVIIAKLAPAGCP